MTSIAQYEVLLVPSQQSLTASEWTWRRLEGDGSVSAQGLHHDTMEGCFGEVRRHRSAVGEATITVNLRGEAGPGAAAPLAPAVELGAAFARPALERRLRRRG